MSLRARLILLVGALAVSLVVGLGIFLGGSVRAWSREALDSELEQQGIALSRAVKLDHGELELDEDHLDAHALHWPYRIEALKGDGLLQAGRFAWPPLPGEPREGVESIHGSRVYTQLFEPRHGRGLRLALRIAAPEETFSTIERRFRAGLGISIALAALLSILGAALVAQLFLRPLRRLSSEVAGIEASALERRLGVDGLDPDLGRLARAFNGVLERLQRAFDLQRAFVARASHALRTPLASILSTAEVTLRRERTAEEYRAALEEIASSARGSARLAENLLALSRAEQRQAHRVREPVKLTELFDELLRLFRAQAQEAEVSLSSSGAGEIAVRVDRALVRELLHALVDNALRYTPRGGRVTLGVRSEADGVWIDVTDNGLGIRPDERERIFERFFRGSAAERLQRTGSGLGLSLVRALADAEGIGLALEDVPGGGTRASLKLPRAE